MSGFSAEWLALREPFDAAARSGELVERLRAHLRTGTAAAPLDVVDLGAGAGSNLRYLAPRLGGVQRWRFVDNDGALLAAALDATAGWAEARGARCERRDSGLSVWAADLECEVTCEQRDLRTLGSLQLPAEGLVTAAALLDLVSDAWLTELALGCAAARAAVCFALTYDGRSQCAPIEPEDALILELFNRHQRSDKTFGRALGPDAVRAVGSAFRAGGYQIAKAPSDWHVGSAHTTMQQALLDGWLGAAAELAPERYEELARWHASRTDHLTAGTSTLTVGHVDLVGWL